MTGSADLARVRAEGKRFRSTHLELRVAASLPSFAGPRLGVIVGKHGHSAIARNKLKRRLRTLIRTRMLPATGAGDAVLRAAPSAYRLDYDALTAEVERLMAKWLGPR